MLMKMIVTNLVVLWKFCWFLAAATQCRTMCGNMPIRYPFGVDDGCGSPRFRGMLNCSTNLFLTTPSGSYKVQNIDYEEKSMTVYDPAMSTCSILQPHHDFRLTDVQNALIPPSSDTVFVLLNCSVDSPVLNHYSNLCFDFSNHTCDELYSTCNAFRVFRISSGNTTMGSSQPRCCFTGYDTVRLMSMNILDCSHYTTVIDSGKLRGVGPLDWDYGIELSFAVPDTGCDLCQNSGGTCGFDTETNVSMCLCSGSDNTTRGCGPGGAGVRGGGENRKAQLHKLVLLFLGAFVLLVSLSW